MHKKLCSSIVCLVALFIWGGETSFAKEPKNLDLIKIELMKYHDSGEYRKDQAKVINQAMQYLKTRLIQERRTGYKHKLAVVLDIDETSLSNYPGMLKLGFGGTMAEIDQQEARGDDPVIAPTLELYHYAKANNVAVFFITGRPENARAGTESNLAAVGYSEWERLILKPSQYRGKGAASYKVVMRRQIEKEGYDIVLNIGDQVSDLVGGYADKTFKLPNPYYIVP